MAFPDAEQLRTFVTPPLRERGLDVEDIKTTKAGKKSQVVIRVDGDTRPSSDDLEQVSHQLSELFDAAEQRGELNFGAGYTLEVSTPGVDLPLTAPRHWRRARGRLINYRVGDADVDTARVGALNAAEDAVALVRTVEKQVCFDILRLENVTHAVVEIEFAQPSAAEVEATQETFDSAEKKAEQNSATRED